MQNNERPGSAINGGKGGIVIQAFNAADYGTTLLMADGSTDRKARLGVSNQDYAEKRDYWRDQLIGAFVKSVIAEDIFYRTGTRITMLYEKNARHQYEQRLQDASRVLEEYVNRR